MRFGVEASGWQRIIAVTIGLPSLTLVLVSPIYGIHQLTAGDRVTGAGLLLAFALIAVGFHKVNQM